VKQAFLDKKIKAPVHLAGGNENQLIGIFANVKPQDWIFSTWRSSYHCLLKGMSEEELFAEILAGRSMYIMNKKHRILCSSIVGGILPIACGVAMGIQRKEPINKYGSPIGRYCHRWMQDRTTEKVWVFVGDMCANTGLFHEFKQYILGHKLPVEIVVENNGFSTNTPTLEVWGSPCDHILPPIEYSYRRVHPHCGVSKNVIF